MFLVDKYLFFAHVKPSFSGLLKKTDLWLCVIPNDEYKSTVTAALQIIDELMEQGYEFVTVDELLFD